MIAYRYKDNSRKNSGYDSFQHFMVFEIVLDDPNSPASVLSGYFTVNDEFHKVIRIINELQLNYCEEKQGISGFTIRFTSKADAMRFKLNYV